MMKAPKKARCWFHDWEEMGVDILWLAVLVRCRKCGEEKWR